MTARKVAVICRYTGKSTDAKPLDDVTGERVQDGSEFFETDTGKSFTYHATEGWTRKEADKITRGDYLVSATYDASVDEKLALILAELQTMNIHLAIMSGETIS